MNGLTAARIVAIGAALLAALVFLSACGGGPQRYGHLNDGTATASIPDLIASPELHLGEEVAVRGLVVEVCRELGCWFQVMESGRTLMVDLDAGRRLSLGADARGHTARVEGTLVRQDGVLKILAKGVEIVPGTLL